MVALWTAEVGKTVWAPMEETLTRSAGRPEPGAGPAARELYPRWEEVAAETVAHLRLDAGRHPDDPLLARLIEELTAGSPEFGPLWARHQVGEKTHGRERMRHPLVGEPEVDYETLVFPEAPDQFLIAYTAPSGSPAAARLALLAEQAETAPA